MYFRVPKIRTLLFACFLFTFISLVFIIIHDILELSPSIIRSHHVWAMGLDQKAFSTPPLLSSLFQAYIIVEGHLLLIKF